MDSLHWWHLDRVQRRWGCLGRQPSHPGEGPAHLQSACTFQVVAGKQLTVQRVLHETHLGSSQGNPWAQLVPQVWELVQAEGHVDGPGYQATSQVTGHTSAATPAAPDLTLSGWSGEVQRVDMAMGGPKDHPAGGDLAPSRLPLTQGRPGLGVQAGPEDYHMPLHSQWATRPGKPGLLPALATRARCHPTVEPVSGWAERQAIPAVPSTLREASVTPDSWTLFPGPVTGYSWPSSPPVLPC